MRVWRRIRDAGRRWLKRRDDAEAADFARAHEYGDVPTPKSQNRDGGDRSADFGGFPPGGAAPPS